MFLKAIPEYLNQIMFLINYAMHQIQKIFYLLSIIYHLVVHELYKMLQFKECFLHSNLLLMPKSELIFFIYSNYYPLYNNILINKFLLK